MGGSNQVDIDGNTAVIGSPNETAAGASLAGTVFVYVKNGSTWTQQAVLNASDSRANMRFGLAVSVQGDTVVVGTGATTGPSKKVYVFTRTGTSWVEQAAIAAPAPGASGNLPGFGAAVNVRGDVLAVTSLLEQNFAYATYVYVRSGGTWTQDIRLAGYAACVALSDTTLVTGTPSQTSAGTVQVYGRVSGVWTLKHTLPQPAGPTGGFFGQSCDIDGDSLVVGAPSLSVPTQTAPDAGASFVFLRTFSPTGVDSWGLQQRLDAAGSPAYAQFGASARIVGDTVALGAPAIRQTVGDGVYVFRRSGTTWSQSQRLDGSFQSGLGGSIALSGNDLWAAISGNILTYSQGAATGAPGAPTNVQATVNGNTLNMTWGAPASGAAPTGYTLIARASAGGPVLGTAPLGNVTSFSAVAPNGVFVLSLVATNASGTGPESAGVSVTLPSLPAPPSAPRTLAVAVVGSTATLSWAAPASGGAVANYVLAAGLTPGFAVPLGVLPLPAAPLSYAIPGIPPGTYYLRLQAQNAGGTSAASNEVTVTVAAPSAPGAPTLNAPTVSGSTVGLSWTPGSGGAPTSYVLTALTSGGVVLGSVPVTGASLSLPNVPSGSYLLRLVAVNSVGPSPVSNTVTLVVP